MAKKTQIKKEPMAEAVQKKMDSYYKAQSGEKKGKKLALSIVCASVLCFIILLIIILKMNGVGKTIVFTTDTNGNVQTTISESGDVDATALSDIAADSVSTTTETETTSAENQN